jgi:membrane protein required for colicin V production
MTALDIFVLLLLGGGAGRLRARLRARSAVAAAWVAAIVALKLFHTPVTGRAEPAPTARRRGGAGLRAPVRPAFLHAGKLLARRIGGGARVGARAARPGARRRLRDAQGADRRDPVLPARQPGTDMVYGAEAERPEWMRELAHLSAAQRQRPRDRRLGRDAASSEDGSTAMIRLYDTMAREKRPFEPADPSASPCMCAGRRSTTAPISAMRGRRWCSTRSPGCSAHVLRRGQPRLRPQRHRRRRQDHRRGARPEGVDPSVITERYERFYLDDMGALGVRRPTSRRTRPRCRRDDRDDRAADRDRPRL